MNPKDGFLQNSGKARWISTVFVVTVQLLWSQGIARAESGTVVLYRLTHCCPESAWTEAEYAVLKELDAMDVSVTLIDRRRDEEEGLESEIADIGRAGDVAALLYFFKDRSKGMVGVRLAIYERSADGVSPHQLSYTIKPSVGAVSIVTLKAAEAVREVLSDTPTETLSESPIDAELQKAPALTPAPAPAPTPAPAPKSEPAAAEKRPSPPAAEKPKAEKPKRTRTRRSRGKIERAVRTGAAAKRFAVGLGPFAVWSAGGMGAAFALDAEISIRIVSGLHFGISGGSTLVSKELQDEEGQFAASYRLIPFQGALSWRFLPRARLHPVIGARGGPVLAVASGLHKTTYGNQNDLDVVWGVFGESALAVDLTDAWGLVIGAGVGALFPEVRIRFIYEEIATIGRPMGNAGIRLEYRF